MSASRLFRRVILVLCLAVFDVSALAQTQTQKEFEPQFGQDGKDVIWEPSPPELVERMLDLAKVTPNDYVIDLGSGDGRTVIAAAKRGARSLGIEYNPDMVELSQRRAVSQGVSGKASFVRADLFATDLSEASVITLFLLPGLNLKLRPKILQLKPGVRIVSNSFEMGEWNADETSTIEDGCSRWCTALLWIVPARVEGAWRSQQGELTLEQSFQMITGTLRTGGRTTPIADGRLRGDQIGFSAGGATYTGRVNGNAIEGTVTSNGSARKWRATRAGT